MLLTAHVSCWGYTAVGLLTHYFRLKGHTLAAMLTSIALIIWIPQTWGNAVRVLSAWDAGMLVMLLSLWYIMSITTINTMRLNAQINDEGRVVILGTVVAAACASLLAIVLLYPNANNLTHNALMLHIGIVVSTLLLSWLLIHTVFTLHYAHAYYQLQPDGSKLGGLEFPQTSEPDYWDFLYFSFVIGMTSQVSDVAISNQSMRRLALIHGILAFFFNTSLLALGINLLASVI